MGLKRFDYKLKDNSKKKSIIVASIIVLVLIVGITIYSTYAAYKVTKTYNIIQGRVGEFVNADVKLTVKTVDTDGNETVVEDFPSQLEYAYIADSSSCTNGSTIEFDKGKWSATISSSGEDKCTLYFEQRSDKTLSAAIRANTTLVETTPTFSEIATDTNTNLYSAEDDLGTSYYFRGAATNNYINFGGYYWRIVRINGDGSVRMIYDGTSAVENGVAHTASIGTTDFNGTVSKGEFLSYTYDINGIETDSEINVKLDSWYIENLANYNNYISDGIFCNDKEEKNRIYYSSDGNIVDTEEEAAIFDINYAPYIRLEKNKNPQLICTNINDKYSIGTTLGNGLLNNPIGLITADEVTIAGNPTSSQNIDYYLYNGENYWTSSNYQYVGIVLTPTVFYVSENGYLFNSGPSTYFDKNEIRPVINLDANIKMYGSGTISDPYRLTKEL